MKTVYWSQSALDDFNRALSYIAGQDVVAAELVAERIDAAALRLGEMLTGRPGRVFGTYEKNVPKTPYIIAYTASDQSVTILRVIHQRRNWSNEEWPD